MAACLTGLMQTFAGRRSEANPSQVCGHSLQSKINHSLLSTRHTTAKIIHLNSNITMPELILLIQGVDDSTDEEIVKQSVTKDPFFERKVVNILRDHLPPKNKTYSA
jgi:hypothetical protein